MSETRAACPIVKIRPGEKCPHCDAIGARRGIEAQNGLNDTFEGDPYPHCMLPRVVGGQCECCGRTVARLRTSIWHTPARICVACFMVWYDVSTNPEDPAAIKADVLRCEALGLFPFTLQLPGIQRISS